MRQRSHLHLECLGGGPLLGDRWVRKLFLDESGIGSIKNDPILVVAGVIIHADTQWRPLAEELKAILDRHLPLGMKRPRFLHAKDIFHGAGEFKREHWPETNRQNILLDLSKMLIDFDLPVVWSAIDRKTEFPDESQHTPSHVTDCYSVAALSCFMQTEAFMRQLDDPNEVASVTLEENRELQKRLPDLLTFAESANAEVGLDKGWQDYMPFTRIMDNPSCQPKSGSSLLQIADYCAFAIKRAMDKRPNRLALGHDFVPQFLRIKPNDPKSDVGFWNPKFMPKTWEGKNLKFENGKLRRVDNGKK